MVYRLPKLPVRLIKHHSELNKSFGDAIIVGASSVKYLEEKPLDLENSLSPEDVFQAIDGA